MAKIKLYICLVCGQSHTVQEDAEKCHKSLPLEVTGEEYTKFETVSVPVEVGADGTFYYKNAFGNLRSVPPRAKIMAVWEAPVVDGEVLMECY